MSRRHDRHVSDRRYSGLLLLRLICRFTSAWIRRASSQTRVLRSGTPGSHRLHVPGHTLPCEIRLHSLTQRIQAPCVKLQDALGDVAWMRGWRHGRRVHHLLCCAQLWQFDLVGGSIACDIYVAAAVGDDVAVRQFQKEDEGCAVDVRCWN